ncbi:MAG: OAM dimerization domain-containing protein, partial [Bacillota bacterium]
DRACDLISGCTLCDPGKIVYIDELDPVDNVETRLGALERDQRSLVYPEVEWAGDRVVAFTTFWPLDEARAEAAGLEMARRLGLDDPKAIHKEIMHPAEGTLVEIKGKVTFGIDLATLEIPEVQETLSPEEIREFVRERGVKIVAATVGQDEHSVGLREILDIKHGGIEGFGIECHYLGTSCPVEKLVNAAIEVGADAILTSTIITHADVHRLNMKKLADLCVEKGIRGRVILVAGGTQVTWDIAVEAGMDAGFGRGTRGIDVASFLARKLREKDAKARAAR